MKMIGVILTTLFGVPSLILLGLLITYGCIESNVPILKNLGPIIAIVVVVQIVGPIRRIRDDDLRDAWFSSLGFTILLGVGFFVYMLLFR